MKGIKRMNKTILYTAILACLYTPVYAEQAATESAPTPTPTAKPVVENATDTPTTAVQPINCDYKIPPEQTEINASIVKSWAEYATVQAFDMSAASLDQEIKALEKCFTKQGWEGFYNALEQSGNLKAIKEQNLTVSSQIDGDIALNPVKENQWKADVPLNVVYQNKQQKLNQILSVNVLVGRKVSGELGIMQIIATPRVADTDKTDQSQHNKPVSGENTPSE